MNLYKRKIYKKSLQHGLKWRNHKYLYIDANGNYVYPEDVKNKAKSTANTVGNLATATGIAAKTGASNLLNRTGSALNKKKAELRSIGRGKYMGDESIQGSVLRNRRLEAKSTRDFANDKASELKKYENGEYFDKSRRMDSEKKEAKQKAVQYEARAKKAENEYNTAKKDKANYDNAGKMTRKAAKLYRDYEQKKIRKNDEKWKKDHADEIAAREARRKFEDERRDRAYNYRNSIGRHQIEGTRQEIERRQAAIDARNHRDRSPSEYRNLINAENATAARKTAKQKAEAEKQRKSAHVGYEEDRRLFPEGGSTEELERQKEKTAARKTKARTNATVEEMRKRKKRMDASIEPIKPTRNISGVKSGGKAPVKETPTPKKKRRSIDRDDLRTYKKAADMMLDEGQQNEINRRKERSERVKAGNAKMRNEINAENAKKVGKALLSGSKFSKMAMAGRSISKAASERKAERQAKEKQKEAEFNRKVKADQAESNAKMKEASKTTAKNMAKNKGMQEVAKAVSKDVAKDVYNETYKELPEGYTIKADGYIYDDIGAVVRKATADDYKKKKVSKR